MKKDHERSAGNPVVESTDRVTVTLDKNLYEKLENLAEGSEFTIEKHFDDSVTCHLRLQAEVNKFTTNNPEKPFKVEISIIDTEEEERLAIEKHDSPRIHGQAF